MILTMREKKPEKIQGFNGIRTCDLREYRYKASFPQLHKLETFWEIIIVQVYFILTKVLSCFWILLVTHAVEQNYMHMEE